MSWLSILKCQTPFSTACVACRQGFNARISCPVVGKWHQLLSFLESRNLAKFMRWDDLHICVIFKDYSMVSKGMVQRVGGSNPANKLILLPSLHYNVFSPQLVNQTSSINCSTSLISSCRWQSSQFEVVCILSFSAMQIWKANIFIFASITDEINCTNQG